MGRDPHRWGRHAAVALLAAAAGWPLAASASDTDVTPLDADDVAERTDQWLAPYVAAHDFSGVVLIAQGDRVLVEKAYGDADFGHQTPNSIDTRFRIASLSKSFTAAGIEMLAKQGKLSFKDHLSRYITGIPNGRIITIAELLTHTSGVGVLDSPDVIRHCLSDAELLRRMRKNPPLFKPGERSEYSNEGYFLLGMIIQKVSGQSYDRFMQQRIFQPLRLQNTGTACQEIPPGDDALGYMPGAAGGVQRMAFDEAMESGPGSIYSDAHDVYRWVAAVDTDPRFQNTSYEAPYGWYKRNYSGHPFMEASGIAEGFGSHMMLYPDGHIYAVVLSNVQSGFLDRISHDLDTLLFGGDVSLPPDVKPVPVEAEALQAYVGSYKNESDHDPLNLTVQDGVLYMHWGHDPLLRILTPTGGDEFYFRSEYATVRFERDATGHVTRTIWQWAQGGHLLILTHQ
jgi:CubicO group peptidase (beta-lactamase class C family)